MKIHDSSDLSVGEFKDLMQEKRPLPIGRTQFDEWSDRIIEGAHVEASQRSMKWTLATMLLHLGPTEAYKEDAYFILALRKAAVAETGNAIMQEIKSQHEAEKKQAEATATKLQVVADGGILEDQTIPSA